MTVQEYNDLYKRPMVKNVKIVSSGGVTITNTNIVSEQMSLEKSLCSESNLRFGRCEAACFKVRIADIDHDFTGEWLNVTQDAKADIEGYLLTQDGKYLYTEDGQRIQVEYKRDIEDLAQLGHFKVYSDKPDNDRRWKNLTCYDRMYDILNADVAAWYSGLTFPMTIKTFRDSFFNYIGVTQKTTTLVNDNFVTQGGFSVTGSLSGKTVIEAICELNGVFGVMAPDDTFDYVSLANPETLTLDYYVDGTGSYEDYVTDVITGICAKGSESDIGTSVGTTENVYTIVNNPLINGTEGTAALTTALNNLLQNVLSISFRPFQVTTYGNPMLPLGTRITINTRNQTIISYVINKEMTGVQGLRDKISAKSDKHQSENINSSYDEIYRTKGKVHELKIDVDGLVSRMATTESKLDNDYYTKAQTESKISQTESEIMTTVSNSYVTQASYNAEIQNLQDQIDGRIEYFDGNVIPTLNNPPANSWTTTATKDSHVGDLYRYHYTDSGVNKTDYYRFDKDTSTTPATFSWVALGESEVDEALRQAELANQKADAAQQQLDALQSDVEDNYYTKSATDSKIQQTANSITQSVSSTYETKSDSTSKFNTANANAQGYANTALATANTNAQGYANSAKDAANAATDSKLTSYYTKTQTDSQIAQTANSITSSVSSTYETKSDATAKLNTANSNAQTYANNARDSANASTDNKLQSYYTKSETNSQIQQTANSITTTVSQTYTTKTEFNSMEIGGRNYVYLSDSDAGKSHNTYPIADFPFTDALVTDQSYVVTAKVNSSAEKRSIGFYHSGGSIQIGGWMARSSDGLYEFIFTANSSQASQTGSTFNHGFLRVYASNNNGPQGSTAITGTANVEWVKVERGTKSTSWSPAPEDLEKYADTVGASTLSTANTNAQTYANNAKDAANAATDQKLTNYSTKSEVTQLSNQIVMKVDTNGNIVQVALSADPSTGTAFTVSANNIDFIADGNIQLTSGTIGIYSTNFQVTSDGTVTAKAGQIGGWKITSTQFYDAVADEAGTTQGAGICKYGEGYAFWAGTSFANRNNAPFLVGHNGTLRASNAIISGTVTSSNLTATGGTVAGWTISSSDGLKHTDSVYGTSGFMHSLGWMFAINASNSTTLSDGRFRIDQLGTAYARSMYLTNQGGGYASLNSYNTVINNTQLIMKGSNGTTQQVYMSGETGNASFKGNLTVSGTKNRKVETPNYGSKLLYCYETPSPLFGDIGEGKIADDGKCYVWLDSTFSETIKTESYQVFLQKYGQGECYVTDRTERYFIVEGDAGMCFGWELKARQAGYENMRLETFNEDVPIAKSEDYGELAIEHFNYINSEREVA